MTGSTSGQISSAGEHDAQFRSPRATAHALRRKRRSYTGLFFVTVVVGVALYGLLYQFTGGVRVSLYGQTEPLEKSEQQTFIEGINAYYEEHPLERFRFALNHKRLAGYLQTHEHDEVREVVAVSPEGFAETRFVLKVREPVARWTIDGAPQYVDGAGVLFGNNYYRPPEIQIVDKSFADNRGRDAVIASKRLLNFIGQAAAAAAEQNLAVEEVEIPATSTRQIYLRIDGGYYIKMTIDRGAGLQAEDAKRTLDYLAERKNSLEYIDVRVSQKAFYKEKPRDA
jgi:hypothetical protein